MLMAQRISLVARRQPVTILARYASGKAIVPEQFTQTIVLSNGATYTVRTTSPKPQVRLTKDTRNHPLWNPSMLREGVNDESEQLTKFQKRFGDLGGLDDISFVQSDEEVSKAMQKAAASGGQQNKAAKGKAKRK
jgi:ribosomal protein L31